MPWNISPQEVYNDNTASPDICVEIAVALAQSGADILELGIPFADATVGGVVIQDATKRALQRQIDMTTVFSIIKKIRKQTDTPIILSAYYNPIFAFGEQEFCDQAIQSGACGVVVLDLPFGERSSLYQYAAATFPKIELFTTATSEKRLEKIAKAATGFLVFMPQGGASDTFDADITSADITSIEKRIEQAKAFSALPICIDIGNGPEKMPKAVIDSCDGVIISTGFIAHIAENLGQRDIALRLGARAAEIKLAIRG